MRRRVIAAIKSEELVKDKIIAALEYEIKHGDMERMAAIRRSKQTL
ncbi:MAG: hypothetical protein IKN81_11520 [Oscillospiraceae bacterium]|nr:hypothetical protein [Oscillospiraceae bacterium]